MADLRYLRESGIATDLAKLAAKGTAVIGICGGYQMLGRRVIDSTRVESDQEVMPGLGLLPLVTRFSTQKQTHQVSGCVAADRGLLGGAKGLKFEGYEIHMGTTVNDGETAETPFRLWGRSGQELETRDGAMSDDGWIMGTYVHGLFQNTALRRSILSQIAGRRGISISFKEDPFSQSGEYDKLAGLVRSSLDMDAIYEMVGLGRG